MRTLQTSAPAHPAEKRGSQRSRTGCQGQLGRRAGVLSGCRRCPLHLALPVSPELSAPGCKLHGGSALRSRTRGQRPRRFCCPGSWQLWSRADPSAASLLGAPGRGGPAWPAEEAEPSRPEDGRGSSTCSLARLRTRDARSRNHGLTPGHRGMEGPGWKPLSCGTAQRRRLEHIVVRDGAAAGRLREHGRQYRVTACA